MVNLIGWDIGGAHLKAVLLNAEGSVVNVKQIPCPLWLGLDKLETSMLTMLNIFDISPMSAQHSVTMTGELVDLFDNRKEGVIQIAQKVNTILGQAVHFYQINEQLTDENFIKIDQVPGHIKYIASANWHASATLLSLFLSNAILVDIGSTTTDIIPIENGRVVNMGITDHERMQQDTLVYTGVVRTPVMAISQKVKFDNNEINVAAEYFATSADIYRLTGELPTAIDMADTADGKPKTINHSAKRLARMVGCDLQDKPLDRWKELAFNLREKQLTQIMMAVKKHLKKDMIIIGAGAGRFLIESAAHKLGYAYKDFSSILGVDRDADINDCLPAYAVAKLAYLRVHSQ